MNALHMARSAYSAPNQTTMRTPRATEYAAFARVTARLKEAASGGKTAFPALASALTENRRLWRLLACDVAQPDNALPADLRARIFYLYEFTDFLSQEVLAGRAKADDLIEINTAVMRGLDKPEAV
ncbi:flagellar biosynthesis regulator FlaF [Rhodovulum marinum]|uniref:Flagellar protein FlaF n=1 Tax=Rhodovulum marinum TaxID=320662 RepID=A0A4R2PXY6_9RHOB|nr:flagellar biosynthesis regulator FlaF [Rhodovulum marinum]TCP39115.1 flagellar protein FlaF [Rhodovulum marinum]